MIKYAAPESCRKAAYYFNLSQNRLKHKDTAFLQLLKAAFSFKHCSPKTEMVLFCQSGLYTRSTFVACQFGLSRVFSL